MAFCILYNFRILESGHFVDLNKWKGIICEFIYVMFMQAEKINTLINAAGVTVESIWPSLFASALEGKDIGALVSNVGSGAAAAAPAAVKEDSGDAGKEEKKEEKKEESEEESDDDMGFGKFWASF